MSRISGPVVPLLCALALLLSTAVNAQENIPEAEMTRQNAWGIIDQAVSDYQEGEFGKAAEAFSAVAESAPEGEVDLDALRLAAGQAWLKSGDAARAYETLEAIEGFDADTLQTQKRLAQGNAAYQLAQQALDAQDLETAKTQSETAQDLFRRALQASPSNEDAAHNLELTQQFIKQLPEPPPQENQDEEEQENEDQEDSEEQDQQSGEDQQEQDQQSEADQQEQESQDQQDQHQGEQQEQDSQDEQDQQDQGEEDEDQESQQDSQSDQQSDPSNMSDASDTPQEPTEDYSEEQAQQLLDTYDEQERRQRRQFLQRRSRSIPVEKDW